MTDRVGLARLYLVWPTVRAVTPQDDAELDVLADVLAGGKTSRLYRSLVREKQIAQDVQAYQHGQELAGQFMIIATARPGHTLAELEAAVAEEIAPHPGRTAHGRGDRPGGQHASSRSWSGRWSRSSEFGGRADRLNMYNVLTGDPGYLTKDFDRYLKVDPAGGARSAAKKYLGPGRVVLEVTPGKETTITPDPRQPAAAARERTGQAVCRTSPAVPAATADDAGRGPLPEGGQGTGVPPAADPAEQALQRHGSAAGREPRACRWSTCTSVFPVGRRQDPGRASRAWPT